MVGDIAPPPIGEEQRGDPLLRFVPLLIGLILCPLFAVLSYACDIKKRPVPYCGHCGTVEQSAESIVLKSVECGFESHPCYLWMQNITQFTVLTRLF